MVNEEDFHSSQNLLNLPLGLPQILLDKTSAEL